MSDEIKKWNDSHEEDMKIHSFNFLTEDPNVPGGNFIGVEKWIRGALLNFYGLEKWPAEWSLEKIEEARHE